MANAPTQVASHQGATRRSSVKSAASASKDPIKVVTPVDSQCQLVVPLDEVPSQDMMDSSGQSESAMEVDPYKGRKRHADADSEPPSS